MRGRTRQIIGTIGLTLGVVIFYNAFDFYEADSYWLMGAFIAAGVLLFAVGWKLIQRGRADSARELADEHSPENQRQRESSREDPRETR